MKHKRYLIQFVKYLILGLLPFVLFIIFGNAIKLREILDMVLKQAFVLSLLSGLYGILLLNFKERSKYYKVLLTIYMVIYMLLVMYLLSLFIFGATRFPMYTDV